MYGNEDDYDDDGLVFEDPSNYDSQEEEEEEDYSVLSLSEIHGEMNSIVIHVSLVVGLEHSQTRVLLNYFQWNQDKLFEK